MSKPTANEDDPRAQHAAVGAWDNYVDGMIRAAACVDESDHHALMYVRHGQTVRKEGVDE